MIREKIVQQIRLTKRAADTTIYQVLGSAVRDAFPQKQNPMQPKIKTIVDPTTGPMFRPFFR